MSIIEQIKAEIERLKGIGGIVPLDNREQKTGYESALIDIEIFLDTLESEKPMDGLEDELKDYLRRYYNCDYPMQIEENTCSPTMPHIVEAARHFAKWGEHNALEHLRAARRTEEAYQEVAKEMRKQIKESGSSEIPKDLDVAAIQAAQSDMQDRQIMEASNDERMLYSRIFRRGFKAGAEWQKEQMEETHCPRSEKWKEVEETARYEYENGWKNCKEQMMKEAVEGLICATITGTNAISFLSPLPKELMAGDKVRIIIVKEDNHE